MFGITTEFSILYIALCLLLGLLYSYILYRKNIFLSKNLMIFLFILRFFLVSVLAFLLLDPVISSFEITEEKPIVVLAQDASPSCFDIDDFNKFEELRKNLSDKFETFCFNYSDHVREGFSSSEKGLSTNISQLIDEVDVRFSGRNLLGVVLSSDGLFNEGVNPIYHKSSKSIPFYTIAVGDTSILKDVRISDVVHNEVSFLGNISPIQVQVQSDKYKGREITVNLYKGDNLLNNQTIQINTNSDFLKLDFSIENKEVGLQEYRVSINPLDGERSIENNSVTFFMDIFESKYKILVLSEVVHPDVAAIKSVIENKKDYDIDFFNTKDFNSSFDEYNLIITCYLSNKSSEIITELNNSKIPILIFVNSSSVFSLNTLYSIGNVSGINKNQDAIGYYNSNFTKFNLSEDLQNYFAELSPLVSISGNYSISPTSEVLLYQRVGNSNTEKPLIILDDNFDNKTCVIYGEGVWRWRINDIESTLFHQNFDELFSKISKYLLIQEDKSRFRVAFDKKVYEGNDIVFKCEYYNENYELNNAKEIEHAIINADGQVFDFVYSKNNSSYYLNVGSLACGKYSFISNYNGGQEKFTDEFTVIPKQIERNINSANHQLLYQISQESNAMTFSDFNIEEIQQSLINSSLNKTIFHSSEKIQSIIKMKWLLVLFLLVFSLEWTVRKYHGSY